MSPFQASKVTSLLKSKEIFQDETSWKGKDAQFSGEMSKGKLADLNYVDLQLDFGSTGPAFAVQPAAQWI